MEWSFVLRIYNALTIVHWKSTTNLSLLNAHEDFSIQNKRESRRRRRKRSKKRIKSQSEFAGFDYHSMFWEIFTIQKEEKTERLSKEMSLRNGICIEPFTR